jgi:hypothetical protein
MHVYPLNRYVPGDQKDTCSRCGFDYLKSQLVEEERTGLMVCSHCYDPPHPQDNRPYSTANATKNGTMGRTDNDSAYVDLP